MQRKCLFVIVAAVGLAAWAALAQDICSICGKPIDGTIYLMTDEVTGKTQMVCSNCLALPRCFICGLPVNDTGLELPDGRHLCARDAKTAVLNADDAQRIAEGVHDDLDRVFSRFTSFPTNVNVTVLDRIDVDQMFQPGGYDFESPNLLGCIQAETNAGQKQYEMRLMTGLPRVELEATVAHEFSHAWVGENVPPERHAGIARDAEEGFCELVAYLLMDAQHEEAQKQFILKNHYTRGQVALFIDAEQHYGFDQVLDWMQHGVGSQLEAGHLDAIREVTISATPSVAARPSSATNLSVAAPTPQPAVPDAIQLQGILWGNPPAAIINRHLVHAHDQFKIKIGDSEVLLRCVEIQRSSVRIENVDSGQQSDLHL